MNLTGRQRAKLEQALKEVEEQIELFPESGRVSSLTTGREDLREIVFADGYRLLYGLFDPETITIISLISPGSSEDETPLMGKRCTNTLFRLAPPVSSEDETPLMGKRRTNTLFRLAPPVSSQALD